MVQYGFHEADPVVAGLISIVVIYTTIPLAKETSHILLLAAPTNSTDRISNCILEVGRLDNVLNCDKTHFWSQSNGVVVGTLQVEMRKWSCVKFKTFLILMFKISPCKSIKTIGK